MSDVQVVPEVREVGRILLTVRRLSLDVVMIFHLLCLCMKSLRQFETMIYNNFLIFNEIQRQEIIAKKNIFNLQNHSVKKCVGS